MGLSERTATIIESLPEQQREVLALAAGHHTAKEIGQLLDVSHRTVEQRLDAARKKLGATSRAEAARMFQQHVDGAPYQIRTYPDHIDSAPVSHPSSGQPNDDLVFSDVVPFSQTAPWSSGFDIRSPGRTPTDLGSAQRLVAIVAIAVASLALVLVGLGVSNALSDMF